VASVVFLNRYYWPDLAATAQQLTDLAEDLAASGTDVTVVASRAGYDDPSQRLTPAETRRGVRIVRLATTRFGRARLAGRVGDYLTYMMGALFWLLRAPKPDLIIAASDPPFLLAPALVAGRLRGVRVIYNARDLYPYLAERLGVFRASNPVYRSLLWFASRLHRAADAVVALGPRMARTLIAHGARPERTTYIRDGADPDAIAPVAPADNPLLAELGLADKFVVLYSGNAGRAHTFDAVLEAARRLRKDPGIVFVFIGGGSKRPELERIVQAEGLPNVLFFGYFPREKLRYSLSMADISLVTESPAVAELLIPCKTYGIMASGRPLVFVGSESSEVAEMVREADCGHVVAPDDPDTLTKVILRLREEPGEAEALSRRSREAAETRYSRGRIAEQWRACLDNVLDGTRIGPPAEGPASRVAAGVGPPATLAAKGVASAP
jgi:glycosyltransferase involved in cell wall biosynthesis